MILAMRHGVNYICNAVTMPQGRENILAMDEKKVEAQRETAPYLPFKTFLNSLDTFSQGLPSILDRTIWRSQAGLTQGLIMNTYHFLGLVDEYDSPTD